MPAGFTRSMIHDYRILQGYITVYPSSQNANWGWSWMIYVLNFVLIRQLVSWLVSLGGIAGTFNERFLFLLFFFVFVYIYILYTHFFYAYLACFTSNWSIRIWRLLNMLDGFSVCISKCQTLSRCFANRAAPQNCFQVVCLKSGQ